MAMGKRERQQQQMWIATQNLPVGGGHVFYDKLEALLRAHDFDAFVERRCAGFYAGTLGRPSIPPGVYFRMLMIGYFEAIDSERGIAWRCADSLSLRRFLGVELERSTPDHSTLSRTRRLIDLQTHREVFTFVLKVLGENGLIDGRTVGVDATTLEANAAMRSIVRRDTGEGYRAYLEGLAKASGIEEPTREQLVKLDKKRKNKGSNDDWEHPHDPDAKIAKMKDGRTHLAHKAEHAVDLGGEGAVLSVELYGADEGDTSTLGPTILSATEQLRELADDPHTAEHLHEQWMSEVVTDKGYHSNQTLVMLEEMAIRSYASEPDRGRRKWEGKPAERDAVYANRRRVRGARGKRLLRKRGERLERPFEHYLDDGRMRRVHLRGRENILKRLLVNVAGFNLGLLMRRWLGAGTPRGLAGLRAAVLGVYAALHRLGAAVLASPQTRDAPNHAESNLAALKLAA
jgi:transposase